MMFVVASVCTPVESVNDAATFIESTERIYKTNL